MAQYNVFFWRTVKSVPVRVHKINGEKYVYRRYSHFVGITIIQGNGTVMYQNGFPFSDLRQLEKDNKTG
jgi:hypothetical protein